MNLMQKERIAKLRSKGITYKKIADELELSINTVKSFCRRSNLADVALPASESKPNTHCANCGVPITHTPGKKAKKYCSDHCRLAWWNNHPEAIIHKSIRLFICETCGTKFEGYGKRERKYCTRACNGKSKMVHHE